MIGKKTIHDLSYEYRNYGWILDPRDHPFRAAAVSEVKTREIIALFTETVMCERLFDAMFVRTPYATDYMYLVERALIGLCSKRLYEYTSSLGRVFECNENDRSWLSDEAMNRLEHLMSSDV